MLSIVKFLAISMLVILTSAYIIGAFVFWDYNLSHWPIEIREGIGVVAAILWVCSAMIIAMKIDMED